MKYYIYTAQELGLVILEASNEKDAARKLVMAYAVEEGMSAEEIKADIEETLDTHMFIPESEVNHLS